MASDHGGSQRSSSRWIHCNRCFESYIQKQKKLFILSCYDVACESCLTTVHQNQFNCPVCKRAVKGFHIANNMPQNLKDMFHPRPWTLGAQKSWAVVRFQTKQRDKFLFGCNRMAEYNRSLEVERNRVKAECRKAYYLHQKTRHERKRIEDGAKKFIGGTKRRRSFKRDDHFIHPTFHAPRNEFEFTSDSHLSKSFIL